MASDDKKITSRAEDFSQWYLDVIAGADLAEHSPVRGSMIIKPEGYALWERIVAAVDGLFKEKGVRNAYFPLFIPESFLKREADHVEGFAPEVAVVTHAGGEKLNEPLIVRPTSETIINDAFSRWVHSYRDLPLIINQWANVVRWELRPRLFLRTTEFLWQEGHTAHATPEEADARAREMLEVYRVIAEDYLAIPTILGVKSDSEKFAGAEKTYTVETMMQDGKALQFSTSHNLGQNFSKPFNIQFATEAGGLEYAWQTSWGLSTRVIGGLIMCHSDDTGLVLPPNIAPVQVVITSIGKTEGMDTSVLDACQALAAALRAANVRVHVDARSMRPGEKFFEWEKKGVPVRVEVGPKDIEKQQVILARRDRPEKHTVAMSEVTNGIRDLLTTIQKDMYGAAKARRDENTISVNSWDEFEKAIEAGKFVLAHWSGRAEDEAAIKEKTKATVRCIPLDAKDESGTCIISGKPSPRRVIFARSY